MPSPTPSRDDKCRDQGVNKIQDHFHLNDPPKPGPKPVMPYEEISATFNGNEVKIRVPKSRSKPPILTPSQLRMQQECTCADDDTICSETCGLDGLNPGHDNTIDVMLPDDLCESLTNRTHLNSEMVYSRQEGHDPICSVCNVTPKDAPKGVKAQKILHPNKDVFLLKIGKQTDEPNRTGNIEVELVTPRAPAKYKPPLHACQEIQCEEHELPCCYGACMGNCDPACIPKRRRRRRI